MLERDPHAPFRRESGEGLPEGEQLRQIILKRLIKQMPASLVEFGFHNRPGKSRDSFSSNMRGHLDGSPEGPLRKLRLARIKRITVIGANRRNPNAPRLG